MDGQVTETNGNAKRPLYPLIPKMVCPPYHSVGCTLRWLLARRWPRGQDSRDEGLVKRTIVGQLRPSVLSRERLPPAAVVVSALLPVRHCPCNCWIVFCSGCPRDHGPEQASAAEAGCSVASLQAVASAGSRSAARPH